MKNIQRNDVVGNIGKMVPMNKNVPDNNIIYFILTLIFSHSKSTLNLMVFHISIRLFIFWRLVVDRIVIEATSWFKNI